MAEWSGTTVPPGSVVLPSFPEPPDAPIVATINAESKRLATAIELLLAATGSGDATTEPEPIELLTIDRPTATGSSLAIDAAHRSMHVSATRAAELNHAELFARTAISTAQTASENMRRQLIGIANAAAGTLRDKNDATPDWNVKGPPIRDEIDAAAYKVIRVAANTNETMRRAAGLVKSIFNEWPNSEDYRLKHYFYSRDLHERMQREQVALLTEMMSETPAGSPDGMEPIPGMSPTESFIDSVEKFGGFMIVHDFNDAFAPVGIANELHSLGPNGEGGVKHFATTELRPYQQDLLDALENGNPKPLSDNLDKEKARDDYNQRDPASYNARIDSVKVMLQEAALQGYKLHAVGGVHLTNAERQDGQYLRTEVPYDHPRNDTHEEATARFIGSRIPDGEAFILHSSPGYTELGLAETGLGNLLEVPSYDVFNPERHSFSMPGGDGEERVPLVNATSRGVYYNVFAVPGLMIEPESDFLVELRMVGS